MIVIECYDPSTPSYKFVKDVFLYKNEDYEPFIKSSNSLDTIKDYNFVTNGQTLIIQTNKKAYFFDMKTGIRQQKANLDENFKESNICYDYHNSVFYSFRYGNSNTRMEAFTISNFKKGSAGHGFAK